MLLVQIVQLSLMTDAKLYVPVVTLSTDSSAKLAKQVKDLKDQFIGTNIKQLTQNLKMQVQL